MFIPIPSGLVPTVDHAAPKSDTELIQRLKLGDKEAADELIGAISIAWSGRLKSGWRIDECMRLTATILPPACLKACGVGPANNASTTTN